MGSPHDAGTLTTTERHTIVLLRQGPQPLQRLAEILGLTLEKTLHVLQSLDRKVGIVPLYRYSTLRYGLAE